MKSNILAKTFLSLFTFFLVFSVKAQYCIPSSDCSTYAIDYVGMQVAGIDNENNACGITSTGYSDYTHIEGAMTAGLSSDVFINLDPLNTSTTIGVVIPYIVTGAVFVDFNQNGSLDDPGESFPLLVGTDLTGADFVTGTFTVPPTALEGPTRMRVRYSVSTGLPPSADELNITPCVDLPNGETEDYTLIITNPIPSLTPTCVDTATFLPKHNSTDVCTHLAELSWVDTGGTTLAPASYLVNVHMDSNDSLVYTTLTDSSFTTITSQLQPNTVYYWTVEKETALAASGACDTLYFTTAPRANPTSEIRGMDNVVTDTLSACHNQPIDLQLLTAEGNGVVTSSWTSSEIITPSDADTVTFTSDSVGDILISVRVTDELGCYSEDLLVAQVGPTPENVSVTESDDTVPCVNGAITYYLHGTFDGASAYYLDSNDVEVPLTVTNSDDSTYHFEPIPYPVDVNIVFERGECTEEVVVTISAVEEAVPTPVVEWPTEAICIGNEYLVRVTNSQANYTTEWSNGMSGDTIYVSESGNVYAFFENECETVTSDTFSFVFQASPGSPTISATNGLEVCSGDSLLLTVNTLDSVVWQTLPVVSSKDLYVLGSGDYHATVYIGECSANTDTVTVSEIASPAIPTISANSMAPYCKGDTVELSTTSTESIEWSTGETNMNISAVGSGTYSVTATNAEGCSSSDMLELTFGGDFDGLSVDVSGATSGCDTNSAILSIATTHTVVWEPGTVANDSLTVNTSGDYVATLTDDEGCTISLDAVSVRYDAIPAKPVATHDGDSIRTTAVSGATYVWTDGNGVSFTTPSASFKPSADGNYTVQVITENGCESEVSDVLMFTDVFTISNVSTLSSLYPNPNTGEFTLSYSGNSAALYSIVDLTGKEVAQGELMVGDNVLSTDLTSGVYLLKVGAEVVRFEVVK